MNVRLGFLGYGNMGSAILEGLIRDGKLVPHDAYIYDPDADRQLMARTLGISVVETVVDLAQVSDVLVLAVKPQIMQQALSDISGHVRAETLVVSIAAGVSSGFIDEHLGGGYAVVRVMPNTPALVQAGTAGLAPNAACSEAQVAKVVEMFKAVGIAEVVKEEDLDALTAVSGSGPAYFFMFVECLTKAAVAEGLSPLLARRLAEQTLFGAGKLLCRSNETAQTLRERVTSPGGTTEAALKQLTEDGLERIVERAVHAATERSRELGQ